VDGLRRVLVQLSSLRAAAVRVGLSAGRWLLPRGRGALLRSRRVVRELGGQHLLPWLATLRRMIAAQLSPRRRRTTAGPPSAKQRSSGVARSVLLGVLGAGAVALAVYALAPSDAGSIELHRNVQAVTPVALEPTVVQGRPQPAAPVPAPATVPSDSPFAVDVREQLAGRPGVAAASAAVAGEPATRRSLVFGQAQAPAGKRYTLRMSAPVRELKGIPDKGGFTVIIPGALSLDRAGPIGANHRAVQRSMILNKGDRAELTIRFAEGKQPAYQVKAVDDAIEIVIEG
jgi:hypothetical protein